MSAEIECRKCGDWNEETGLYRDCRAKEEHNE
jgi:hypothetical protein